MFKTFIDEILADCTPTQHTLLKNRTIFYPAAYDSSPKTNTAEDDGRWLATMAIDILLETVNTFPKGLLPDGDGWVFSSVSRSNSLDAVWTSRPSLLQSRSHTSVDVATSHPVVSSS